MKLYEKMYQVMLESEAIEKSMVVGSGKNSYKAVSEAAMLNAVKPLFKKYKLIIFPIEGEIRDHVMTWDKTDFNNNTTKSLRAMTELKVYYKIVDTESGESETLVGFGNGADPQDKGAGKAFTYSFKNVLSKTFMLFSGEDTDNSHSDDIGREEPKPKSNDKATKKLSEGQVKRLFAIANSKGITPEQVKKGILKDYSKINVDDLTKKEYDELCSRLENAKAN